MIRRNMIASSMAAAMVVGAGATATRVVAGSDVPERRAVVSGRPISATPVTVVQDQYVDDLVYTTLPPTPAAPLTGPTPPTTTTTAPPSSAAVAFVAALAWGAVDTPSTTEEGSRPPAAPATGGGTTTTTAAPRGTTSATTTTTTSVTATTTTTTLPPGARVPRDWPPGKPYPPIPPGCKKPQLEDNGVWNCDN